MFFNGEPRMSDKLLIDLFGLTISADGICAIVAAVVIVLVIARRGRDKASSYELAHGGH
jgi:hypothetical protein